jgi:hypothetical protein
MSSTARAFTATSPRYSHTVCGGPLRCPPNDQEIPFLAAGEDRRDRHR